jgi:L-ribulose-5-phosphate 3-epimerase
MDIGITLYFGFELKTKEAMNLIKKAGFNSFITSADKRLVKIQGTLGKQVKYAKKIGLKLSSLHSTYRNSNLFHFWLDDRIGNKIEKRLKKEVKICAKYGFTSLVVHLYGEPSRLGISRINRILKVCEKYNVPLAIENIDCKKVFDYTMSEIRNNKYLKFCYDSGHNNVFSHGEDLLGEYGDKLVATHLHDNMGEKDDHTLNQFGNIDWDFVAKRLAKTGIQDIDYELLMYSGLHDLTKEQVLSMCYQNAVMLRDKILKYRSEK